MLGGGGGGEKTGVAQVNNWPFVTSGYFKFEPEMFGRYSGKARLFSDVCLAHLKGKVWQFVLFFHRYRWT